MATFRKITYYDLREEIRNRKLSKVVGRRDERERLTRVVGRRINNNILIVGPGGMGKTALLYGWLKDLSENEKYDALHFFQFDADHLFSLSPESEHGERFQSSLEKFPASVIAIDNFGRAVHNSPQLIQQMVSMYGSLLKGSQVRFVLTLEPHQYAWLEREHPAFVQLFETLTLKNQPAHDQVEILRGAVSRLNDMYRIVIPTDELKEIISYTERFPVLGQSPRSAISLLDESISYVGSKGKKTLRHEDIAHVVAGKTGIPVTQLSQMEQGDVQTLKHLEENLNQQIINQRPAIKKIATTLQRAKLGLRNPNKPLGSFLLLGPSGVGKTETAKLIAETMFGRSESFIRFDMSEFQQDHTVQRLVGAPAGYVGYEQGGALTNALRKEPHSLILLDEIEKAHPKVFDLFLQVLDDGRLTSGQNETVDARNAIFMATSNVAVDEILQAFAERGESIDDAFMQEKIMPALTKSFRLEFINRFDNVLVFNPLTLSGLVEIAQLEIKKIEKRLAKHRVQFSIDSATLEEHIRPLADPRFGARPVKRFVEETCESLLMTSLLATDA